jgi:hypothetical protein
MLSPFLALSLYLSLSFFLSLSRAYTRASTQIKWGAQLRLRSRDSQPQAAGQAQIPKSTLDSEFYVVNVLGH